MPLSDRAKHPADQGVEETAVSITAGLHLLSVIHAVGLSIGFPYPCGIGQGTVAI